MMLERVFAVHLERIAALAEELEMLAGLGNLVGADGSHQPRLSFLVGDRLQDAGAISLRLGAVRWSFLSAQ